MSSLSSSGGGNRSSTFIKRFIDHLRTKSPLILAIEATLAAIAITAIVSIIRKAWPKKKRKRRQHHNIHDGQPSSSFNKINPVLDSEHDDILNAIDVLYDACDKHWRTEDGLYEEGLAKMPSWHQDVKKEWKQHQTTHRQLLDNIKKMKGQIIDHINTVDTRHFHWTQTNNH